MFFSNTHWTQLLAPLEILMSKISQNYICQTLFPCVLYLPSSCAQIWSFLFVMSSVSPSLVSWLCSRCFELALSIYSLLCPMFPVGYCICLCRCYCHMQTSSVSVYLRVKVCLFITILVSLDPRAERDNIPIHIQNWALQGDYEHEIFQPWLPVSQNYK